MKTTNEANVQPSNNGITAAELTEEIRAAIQDLFVVSVSDKDEQTLLLKFPAEKCFSLKIEEA